MAVENQSFMVRDGILESAVMKSNEVESFRSKEKLFAGSTFVPFIMAGIV